MKRIFALVLIASLSIPGAYGATKKPTPKPTIKIRTQVVKPKATVKATPKPSVKASKKPTAKATARATTKVTSKVTAKATSKSTKKAVVKKKVVRKAPKKVRVTSSPKPKWPPAGFYTDDTTENDVFARVPTTKELVGVISAKASLSERVSECEKVSCGAVQVASFIGCSWWEVTSTLYATETDKSRRTLGTLRTLVGKSAPQQILTILLISKEPLTTGHIIDNISVACHRDTPSEDFPQYQYTPSNG